MSKWISVKDAVPTTKGKYLVAYHPCYWDNINEETAVGVDNYRGGNINDYSHKRWARHKFQRVTHWMPLPQPPKEVE